MANTPIKYKFYLLHTTKLFILRPLLACILVIIIGLLIFPFVKDTGSTGYERLGLAFVLVMYMYAGFVLASIIMDIIGLIEFYKIVKRDQPTLYKDTLFYSLSAISIITFIVALTGFTAAPFLQLFLPFLTVGSLRIAEARS